MLRRGLGIRNLNISVAVWAVVIVQAGCIHSVMRRPYPRQAMYFPRDQKPSCH
jgi:hypothetical protein